MEGGGKKDGWREERRKGGREVHVGEREGGRERGRKEGRREGGRKKGRKDGGRKEERKGGREGG